MPTLREAKEGQKKKKKDVDVSKWGYIVYRKKKIKAGDIPMSFTEWKKRG